MVPQCLVDHASSNEPDFTLAAWFVPKLAYLSMPYILMADTTGSAGQLKNK